ncbi:EAL domain-containing protein [Sulfurimonas sp. HSL-1716]|uniref:EAL domain-containing protein n=1 Tax=Hydrocurvibacter sulfurireducens TaxID=3131937 RepID=UPI0031F9080F
MTRKTTYAKITAKIIFITMLLTLMTAFIYGQYMKKEAISSLAYVDAKKTSMFVFETLYSAMQRGWNKSDIYEIISRLNRVDPNMRINAYRSKIVADRFGDIDIDKNVRETESSIIKAMRGKEILDISQAGVIKYSYPVTAKNECIKCHTNAEIGDVLGVINVVYPIDNLKISLDEMINFFIVFIIIFSIVIFIAIFFELNIHLIKPIKNFSNVIRNITNSKDITKRVDVCDNIEEIDSIKDTFNEMLSSIEYQFYHDTLTGLENRKKLTEKLEKKVNTFLMIINIDSFQEINDLYGDQVGDVILKEFAAFLIQSAPKKGIVYRLHSDEFAYLCQDKIDLAEFKEFAADLSQKIYKKSFNIDSKGEVSLTATIGISYGSEVLLANADIALSLAKKNRKNYLVYEESMAMAKEYEKNLSWTKRLKKAIDEDRVVPLFQPIVDVKTQKIVKYESLIRISDHEGGYITPIHFLELSKKNKLYHNLTKIMIEKTFKKFEDLSYFVSINISVEDILNKEIHALILEKLKNSPIRDRVVFEIIESEGIENFNQVIEFIDDVKRYGAKISIDDFGTGYSNFEYLMKLKVDYIKIDGSMIKNIDTDTNSQMITQTIVDFAKKMNIQTIAEFVCSKDVFDKIVELGVDYAQGHHFGKPTEL